MNSHVTRTMPYWERFFDKAIGERIFIAPKEVLEYIELDNRKNGYPNRPAAASLSAAFLSDIKNAVNEIPDSVKGLSEDKFAGIFLVNDLGGTGFSESILDEKGNPVAGFIILDAGVLENRTANQWATWKESTPFKADPSIEINATIETKENDNRKNAIQYIFLHELGHVISINENYHPFWLTRPENLRKTRKYPFFHESWQYDDRKYRFITRFDSSIFPQRKNLVYYFGAKLDASQMLNTYTSLENTNFVTLYAATNPYDDWAESFVTYVHAVIMKKPFEISIKENGKTEKSFELCWGTPRCAKKESILFRLFEVY